MKQDDAEFLSRCHTLISVYARHQLVEATRNADDDQVTFLKRTEDQASPEFAELGGSPAAPSEGEGGRRRRRRDPRMVRWQKVSVASALVYRIGASCQAYLQFIAEEDDHADVALAAEELEELSELVRRLPAHGVMHRWEPWEPVHNMLGNCINRVLSQFGPAAMSEFRAAGEVFERLRTDEDVYLADGLEACAGMVQAICRLLLTHGHTRFVPMPAGLRRTPTTLHLRQPPEDLAEAVRRLRAFLQEHRKARFYRPDHVEEAFRQMYGRAMNRQKFLQAHAFLASTGEVQKVWDAVRARSGEVLVNVRIFPGADCAQLTGVRDKRLGVEVTATAAEDAEEQARNLLAKCLGIHADQVLVESEIDHKKLVCVRELSKEAVIQPLIEALGKNSSRSES